jgi:hypothetical protein
VRLEELKIGMKVVTTKIYEVSESQTNDVPAGSTGVVVAASKWVVSVKMDDRFESLDDVDDDNCIVIEANGDEWHDYLDLFDEVA